MTNVLIPVVEASEFKDHAKKNSKQNLKYFRFMSLTGPPNRTSTSLPHDFSIVPGDVAEQHHGVQLHAALMELLLWDGTKLHSRT